MYVSIGSQQFVSSHDYYFTHRAQKTFVEGHLRLARYYRYHLENFVSVDINVIRTIAGAIETALAISHPGFFDMTSTSEMDVHLSLLPDSHMKISSEISPDTLDVTAVNADKDFEDTAMVPPSSS